MKQFLLGCALVLGTLAQAACSTSTDDGPSVSEDDLTSFATGTYVIDARPFGTYYAKRITFEAGSTYEAEIVTDAGATQLIAGSYELLPAHPNNPDSPVRSDKPTLILKSDSGSGDVSFEVDKLPDGGLRLYHSARHVSFTMKRDPSYRPEPTNTKTIACTGATVDAKLVLDKAQGRRGTLTVKRKAAADREDPPDAIVPMTQTEGGGVPGYVYFEGSRGEQDYYVNMIASDFARGSGHVQLNFRWAEGGQERSVGADCNFE